MVNFKVTIEGVSGLIQSNARIVGLTQPKTEAEFENWYEKQTYRGEDGFLYHPAAAIRNAFIAGAKQCPMKINKKSASSAFQGIISFFPEDFIPLYRNGEQIKDFSRLEMSAVNNNCKPPARIMTYRPKIDTPWEMQFILEVNDEFLEIYKKDGTLNEGNINALRDVLKQAGMKIGIGCFRPEKKGLYGRFKIKSFEQV